MAKRITLPQLVEKIQNQKLSPQERAGCDFTTRAMAFPATSDSPGNGSTRQLSWAITKHGKISAIAAMRLKQRPCVATQDSSEVRGTSST